MENQLTVDSQLTMAIETVTPEMAQQFLDTMVRNRKMSPSRVKVLADAISSGNFLTTHQGLGFNEAGELIDGQHRCQAIIKAGLPVEILITRGISGNTLEAIDIGALRSAADLYEMEDAGTNLSSEERTRISRCAVRVSRRAIVGCKKISAGRSDVKSWLTHRVLVTFIQDHEEVLHDYITALRADQNMKKHVQGGSGWIAAFVVASVCYGREVIDPMVYSLASQRFNHSLNKDPLQVFWQKLENVKLDISRKGPKKGSLQPWAFYLYAVSAIKASMRGKDRTHLNISKKDFRRATGFRKDYFAEKWPNMYQLAGRSIFDLDDPELFEDSGSGDSTE